VPTTLIPTVQCLPVPPTTSTAFTESRETTKRKSDQYTNKPVEYTVLIIVIISTMSSCAQKEDFSRKRQREHDSANDASSDVHPSASALRDALKARIDPKTTPSLWKDAAAASGVVGTDAFLCSLGKAVAKTISTLDVSFQEGCNDVEKMRRVAHAAIDERADRLIADLTHSRDYKAAALERQLEAVDTALQSLRREHAAAHDAAEVLSDSGLIMRQHDITAHLDDVDAALRQLVTIPLESGSLSFESGLPSLISAISSCGTVHSPAIALGELNKGMSLFVGGGGVAADVGAAFATFERAAAAGNTTAAGYLGFMLLEGVGVLKDHERSRVLMQAAAGRGDAYSRAMLNSLGWGVAPDFQSALPLLMCAASTGHVLAEHSLGDALMKGRGCEKDPAAAVVWFKRAADQGYAVAQGSLAACYAKGEGVQKDPERAVAWHRRAAEQGNAEAQVRLGLCYANGEGVESDPVQSAVWYSRAADQGFAMAECYLGLCYSTGAGVTKSWAKAAA
jgi:TPR repeat protein